MHRSMRGACRAVCCALLGLFARVGPAAAQVNRMALDEQFQWPIAAVASSQYGETDWSAAQATGPPDTHGYGDIATAWAPAVRDGGIEWLELTYEFPMIPNVIEVYETCGAGAIAKVSVWPDEGTEWVTLMEREVTEASADPREGPIISATDAKKVAAPTRRVRVEIYTVVPGWNEIDTVALVGRYVVGPVGGPLSSGAYRWWAENAVASSEYGDDSYSAKQVIGLPNVRKAGDYPAAWAPQVKDGGIEWIEVYLLAPLKPTELHVYESCGPGFVRKVEAKDERNGEWVVLWEGVDPGGEGIVVFKVPLPATAPPTHVFRISIDTAVPGWNEIDAVLVVGNPPAEG